MEGEIGVRRNDREEEKEGFLVLDFIDRHSLREQQP